MRILYLAHRVPYPPNKGEKIRAYHQLTHLARRHEVHLACLADDPTDLAYTRDLEAICASVDVVYQPRWYAMARAALALLTGRSLTVSAAASPELHRRVARRVRESRPDIVLAYSSVMAQYVTGTVGSVPSLIDFVDADSEKWRAYAKRRRFPVSAVCFVEGERLGRYETVQARRFDACAAVSQAEADVVCRRARGLSITVLPMGVDLDYFQPVSPPAAQGASPVVVFVGVMNYFPNADAVQYFCLDILPRIHRAMPEVQFHIVGRNPGAAVRRLARLPQVVVTGTVPDVRPYLARAAVSVAPFRIARGVQSKTLEALASGIPVVATPLALAGIPAGEEDGLHSAATPEAFANAVLDLLRQPDLWRTCSAAARQYVERNHSREAQGALLDAMLERLLQPNDRGASPSAGTEGFP